ncbi:hypothetical protein [Paenibacillus dendritiformis]
MKVYVVETGVVWQELRAEKVFFTREKAEEYKKENENNMNKISITEFEVE